MDNSFILAVLAIVAVIGILIVVKNLKPTKEFSVYKSRPVMTAHELVLYHKLVHVLKNSQYSVLSQVSMGAVMDVRAGLKPEHKRSARNRFSQKIVDFVIIDQKGNPKLLIELDDSTHIGSRDAERDKLTASAGLKTERLRKAHKITRSELEGVLDRHL